MHSPHSLIIESLEECGATFEILSKAEHRDYFRRWFDSYDNFYNPERRRLRGARAIAEAEAVNDRGFLLVPCRDPSSNGFSPVYTAFRCKSNRLPDLTEVSHYVDAFISPPDFAWTLLYGHEIDVFGGPEFSYLDWLIPGSIERTRKRE
ncbi:MAG TPA: hypothetical protein VMZ27_00605 [Candidatus Saccharimonadales bacterium]|nr:hypothetical protein [Candidatus Saccharimonadales bacterium]